MGEPRESAFRAAAEAMPDALAICSPVRDASGRVVDFRIDYMNPAGAAVIEYPRERVVGRTLLEVLPGHAGTALFDAYVRLVDEGGGFEEEAMLHTDVFGSGPGCRAFDVRATKLGEGLLVVWRDVTDRRETEEALRRERDATSAILDTAAALLCVFDREGRFLRFNRECERVSGIPASEALGRKFWDMQGLLPAEDVAGVRETWDALMAGHFPNQHENAWLDRQGVPRTITWANSAVRGSDGEVELLVCTGIDVTERRAAEEALAASEARYRHRARRLQLLWETAHVLLTVEDSAALVRQLYEQIHEDLRLDVFLHFVARPDGSLSLASHAGLTEAQVEAVGLLEANESVCGHVAETQQRIAIEDVERSRDPLAAPVRALGLSAFVSHPLCSGRELLGTLAFGSRRRTHFSPDDLEFLQTIARYVALAHERLRLVARLREADRRKDEFLATLAHELRNPLAPIRNAVQVMKGGALDESRLAWSRDVIDRQVDHMARLLEDLLDVSRISRGKIELRRERVDLGAVLDAAVETSRPLVDLGRHELVTDIEPGIHVDGDPVRLAQVFSNLLNNSARYTTPGGHIRVSARAKNGLACVEVVDDGVGIEPDVLPSVFEIFTQGAARRQESRGGLGIGLSIVKGLVQLHRGTVAVRSEGRGRGTSFVVELPLAEATSAPSPERTRGSAPPLPRRVMVVDDNADSADTLAMLLEITGCDVRTAYGGEQAIALAQSFEPNAILLDLGMPGTSGLDVCRRIRTLPWGRDALLVAMTGWGQEEDRRRTREAGFDHHLVKPVDTAVLQAILSSCSLPRGPHVNA